MSIPRKSLASVSLACESVSTVLKEIQPLLEQHWAEIAHYRDIPLDPDYDRYVTAEHSGILRIFTARVEGVLIGYAVYFVAPALHYRHSLQASQDILYLDPAYRRGRMGWKLIQYADEQLRAEGVQVAIQHIKAAHNFGPMLERMGYELIDLHYVRRLDHGL